MKGNTISTAPQQPDAGAETAPAQVTEQAPVPVPAPDEPASPVNPLEGPYITTSIEPPPSERIRWNSKTQSLVLALILFLSAIAITATTVAGNLEQPVSRVTSSQAESSPDDKPSDWLSAWGSAVGAVGTAGALWLGAVTFRRQVRDQHRAQASRVIVPVEKATGKGAGYLPSNAVVSNLSDLPIYDVRLRAAPREEFDDGLEETKPLLVGQWPVRIPGKYVESSVHVEFRDSAGMTWIRWADGGLAEKKGEVYEIE